MDHSAWRNQAKAERARWLVELLYLHCDERTILSFIICYNNAEIFINLLFVMKAGRQDEELMKLFFFS